MQPRHLDALHLRERLLNRRTQHAAGSLMRNFLHKVIRESAGQPQDEDK